MDCDIMWVSQRMSQIRKETGRDRSERQGLIGELKAIWREGFHDTEEYISFFFKNRFDPQSTLIAITADQVAGVAYLLLARVIFGREQLPALLGYAISVSKKYRGQGIGEKIHQFIDQYCSQNQYIYLLHPSNERLGAYYQGIGLTRAGNIKKAVFTYKARATAMDFNLSDISPEQYCRLRDRLFIRDGYLQWDEAAVRYAIIENNFCGGFCKKIICRSGEYAVLGSLRKDKLIITEAVIPEQLLTEILKWLAAQFGVGEVTVYLPDSSSVKGEVIPWIMGYQAQVLQDGYCNLLLN
jgi:GNAT superfamily N-acetyltransferase